MINMGTSLSAMNAFSTGVQGTAHNIANINTGGFQPVSVRYQSGPRDQGVRPVVSRSSETPAGVGGLPGGGSGNDPATLAASMLSGVEPAREMVNLISNQRSFEANAAVIRTGDELLGTIIDLKV